MVYLLNGVKKKKSQYCPRCFRSSIHAFPARWRCKITGICKHAQRHSLREVPCARRARWDGKRSAGGPQRRRWLRRGSTGQRCTSCSETAREGIGGKYGVADPPDPAAGRVGVGDGRMVLRPPPEHLRERASPLPVAAAALPPVHALHGERCSRRFPSCLHPSVVISPSLSFPNSSPICPSPLSLSSLFFKLISLFPVTLHTG